MALPSSGAISFQQINIELKLSPTATVSLNDATVRSLLGKVSGAISMQDAYGKSFEIRFTNTVTRTSVSIFELMGSPTEVANYVFENNAEINANIASYALRTGVFPAGSSLTIINNGYIRGMGGAGSSQIATPGGAGGDAIYLDMACQIDNTNGYILAGGGGGGSAQRLSSNNASYYIRAGGGGGAGSIAGAAGVNAYAVFSSGVLAQNIAPQLGTATSGGAGGTVNATYSSSINEIAYGGAGGTNGDPGVMGSSANLGSSSYKDTPTTGVAGAAGRAIISNGQPITQIGGFGSDRVKGAIV